MKNYFKLFVSVLTIMSIFACSIGEEVDNIKDQLTVKDITVTVVSTTESTVELSWPTVEGVSWYKIVYGQEEANYQDLENNPINYTVRNLDPETSYEFKVEGTAYLDDGKILAEGTATATTAAAAQ